MDVSPHQVDPARPSAGRAKTPGRARPRLIALGVLILAIFGTVFTGTKVSDASWAPNLALDLEGGTQIILTPHTTDGSQITQGDVQQAIEIIRQRVDSSGVSEAEITSQGGQNIVVALPGQPSKETLELVRQSAQMRFRALLYQGAPGPIDPQALAEFEEGQSQEPDSEGTDAEAPAGDDAEAPAGDDAEAPAGDEAEPPAGEEVQSEEGESQPATQEEIEAAATRAADVDGDGELSDTPETEPTSGSDLAWVTEQMWFEYYTLNCSDPANLVGGGGDDPDTALVACGVDGSSKYILGPMEIPGTDIASASSGMAVNAAGAPTGDYAVNIKFNKEGTAKFADVTRRLGSQELINQGLNRFAMVLDGLVISAPTTGVDTTTGRLTGPITGGEAQITGSFTREEAATMARQLSFGALPITFEVQSEEQISATLGSEQLEKGLLAGLIGLVLVVGYSLLQYRGLAVVTVTSLVVAATLTFGVIALLSWIQGYRLSLPGVAGLIIAIGITADSFIVYFERIRDEVREGRPLTAAVEYGWDRARRTIIASDAVNLLAATVLYFLAVGGVRGFAFTLGLTTVIDLIVVFGFTHPIMQLLIRTKFFGGGHKLSGLDPEHLGATVSAYRGRGAFRTAAERAPQSIAERKRQAQREQEARRQQAAELVSSNGEGER